MCEQHVSLLPTQFNSHNALPYRTGCECLFQYLDFFAAHLRPSPKNDLAGVIDDMPHELTATDTRLPRFPTESIAADEGLSGSLCLYQELVDSGLL